MSPETETAIEQRKEMLARVTNTIRLAQEAASSATGGVKASHEHVVFVKTQRKEELERQLEALTGKKPETDQPLTAS